MYPRLIIIMSRDFEKPVHTVLSLVIRGLIRLQFHTSGKQKGWNRPQTQALASAEMWGASVSSNDRLDSSSALVDAS